MGLFLKRGAGGPGSVSGAPEGRAEEVAKETAKDAAPKQAGKRAAKPTRLVRFLSQPLVLEEGGPPNALVHLLVLLSIMIFGFIAWAAVTDLQETAAVTGQIMPAASVQTVQHLEGGIVAEIYARQGEVVEAGQPLLRLDSAAAAAELDQLRAREAALALKAERLRAFVRADEPDFSIGQAFPDLVADQRTILTLQLQARRSQQDVLQSRIEQRDAELASLWQRAENLQTQADIIAQQVEMRSDLVKRGLVSRVVYLETERAYAQALGELSSVQGEIVRTGETLNEARGSLSELEATLANEAIDEMGSISAELAQVREQMAKLEDRVERLLVKSPVHGVVKAVATRTIGSVAAPGDLLLEIVPLEDEMVAEVEIDPLDIGHLRVGQAARVKVTTYDIARLGSIEGRLEHISASTFENERGEIFYKGTIRLAQNYVGRTPGTNLVLPGMVVDGDINTGAKSLMRYLLKPVFRSLDVAFSER